MGIPDTHTMPIPDYNTFTHNSTEHEDTSYIFTCEYIKKDTNIKKFTPSEISNAIGNYRKVVAYGGYGSVYRGILPNNQKIVVKRAEVYESNEAKAQFVNEIIVLSQINNKNAVKFLGCCFETEVPSIVLEYVPNSTLYDHLFDEQKSCLLNWNRRLRIATEVAHVLAYLHTKVKLPVIHRDIKPMNILLDESYIAKVCYFELCKVVEETWESDGIDTAVMGTYGYVDPEYLNTGRLTKKSDVFSFGVVLAELLTRNKAWCVKEEKKLLATNFLKKLKHNRLKEILDEQMVKEGSMQQIKKVAILAGRCLAMRGKDRPMMSCVLRELQDIGKN